MLVVSRKENPPKCSIILEDEATNVNIKQVNEYEYLGSFITSNGRSDREIKRRIGIAKASFCNMKTFLANRKLDIKIRKEVMKTYIWSTLLYGCECWTLSKEMKRRLESAEMWLYRRMLRIAWTDFKSNEEVLNLARARREMLGEIKSRQMRFLGHIMRHSDIEKLVLTGKLNGSKARGRPRKTFMDNFEELGETANEILNHTLDRSSWRKLKIDIVKQRVKKPKLL